MNDVEEMLSNWKDGIEQDLTDSNHGTNLLHEVWTPRCKYFQPPMRKIFRWAYKIKSNMYTNVYPVGIPVSDQEHINSNADGSFDLEFSDNKFESPIIDKVAERLLRNVDTGDLFEFNNNESPSLIANEFRYNGISYHGTKYKNPMITEMANDLLKAKLGEINIDTDIKWPMKIKFAIDLIFSHNEIVSIWYNPEDDDLKSHRIYHGEAWAIPDEYLELKIQRIFGAISDSIYTSDAINILVRINKDTKLGLPKKSNHNKNCAEGGPLNAKIFK